MNKKLNITHNLNNAELFETKKIEAEPLVADYTLYNVNISYDFFVNEKEFFITYQTGGSFVAGNEQLPTNKLEIAFQASENEEILEIINRESDIYDDNEVEQIQDYINEILNDEAKAEFEKIKKNYTDEEMRILDINIDQNYSFKSDKSEKGDICRNFLIEKLEEKIAEEVEKYDNIDFVSCCFSTYDDTIDLEIKGDFDLSEMKQEVLDCAEIVHDKYQSGDYEEAILCIFKENGLPITF